MKRGVWIIKIFLVMLVCWTQTIAAQQATLNPQLINLKSAIDRTAAIVRLLPEFPDNEVKTEIEANLQKARLKYREAEEFARNGQNQRAKLAIQQAYKLLQQIEFLIKQHPIFKIKFQELLERKIQQAEEAVRLTQNEEALYMLNRARFFRRQAYSFFRQGRTYQAIEYYRLAVHFANQTLKIIGRRERLDGTIPEENDWQNLYLDTQMLLERARNLLKSSEENGQFRNMLQKAETEIQDVVRLYERKEYDAAKRKLLAINRALYRIIDVVEKIPHQEDGRLRMDLESLQFSLQSIQEKMSPGESPALRKLYQRSENLAFQIQQHIEQNQPLLARRKMFFANQLVLRMYRMVENQPENQPQEIENRIKMTRREAGDLKQQHTEWAGAASFLGLIDENIARAEEAYTRKKYLAASYYLTITNRLILKYNRLQLNQSRGSLQGNIVQRDLQRLSELLQRVKTGEEQDVETEIRHRNASELHRMANQAFENNELYLCQELTTMAINLITR
jgi:hypothetical protein